jgi:hypothetical protein
MAPPKLSQVAQIFLLSVLVISAGCVNVGNETTTDLPGVNESSTAEQNSELSATENTQQQTTNGENKLSNKLVMKSESAEAISVMVTVEQSGETIIEREIQLSVGGESDLSQELEFDESATVTLEFNNSTEELTISDNEGYVVYVNASGVVRVEAEVV